MIYLGWDIITDSLESKFICIFVLALLIPGESINNYISTPRFRCLVIATY